MKKNYIWRKKFFNNTTHIFSNRVHVGQITNKAFSSSFTADLNNNSYQLTTKGFFVQTTDIINIKQNKIIGTIKYSGWRNKAEIQLNNETYNWSYTNFFNTKWSIHHNYREVVVGRSRSNHGEATFYSDDEVLLLASLAIIEHYSRAMVAVMVVVMIPIIASQG